MEEAVKRFLQLERGSGSGSGYGSGAGYGSGVKMFSGKPVHNIDSVYTLIDHIHGSVARGRILHRDLTTEPCYIVKNDRYFAHGSTLREAQQALLDKVIEGLPVEDKIEEFMNKFQPGTEYPARMFYEWHHFLTGSCKAGRDAFALDHEIDVGTARMTPEAFMDLTKDAYGGQVIRQLMEAWKKKHGED